MKKGFSLILLILLVFSLSRCAKRGTPTGGPIDTIPPRFVRATPENFSTNFDAEEIRMYFNEYIKLEKPQEQIIISPPMSPPPIITPLGAPRKYVNVEILDTLEENTTYVINFGNSIIDNNESNPLPFFKYVFSTGNYIDSLTVSGTIDDAVLKEPEHFVSVMLYELDESFSDSTVYNQPPRYITNTLDSSFFELTNLKEGNYHMVAITDANSNYLYNPGREKIGFVEGPVTIPTEETYNITMFREILPFQPERPRQLGAQKLLIGYRGRIPSDSVQINPLTTVPEDFDYRIIKVPETDSLHLFYKPQILSDTLRLEMITPTSRDTLLTRLIDMPKDSLQISTAPSGNIEFGNNFIITANTPLVEKNEEFIRIINRDSVVIPFTSELKPFENTIHLSFEKSESQSYSITLLPGALIDFFNSTNDTINRSVTTRSYADLGNVTLNLQNVSTFPIIVQLTDEKGAIKAEKYSTSQTTIRFDLVPPGQYLARIIYDRNENGRWDTGDYPRRIKPEEIIYFPDVLDVRPNWDINQTFSVN